MLSLVIGLNLWASLIFGWLFWQYGLLSAMLAHMLFHLVWYPFERRIAMRWVLPGQANPTVRRRDIRYC
jgi:hypothetical protein